MKQILITIFVLAPAFAFAVISRPYTDTFLGYAGELVLPITFDTYEVNRCIQNLNDELSDRIYCQNQKHSLESLLIRGLVSSEELVKIASDFEYKSENCTIEIYNSLDRDEQDKIEGVSFSVHSQCSGQTQLDKTKAVRLIKQAMRAFGEREIRILTTDSKNAKIAKPAFVETNTVAMLESDLQ
ncbi:MAG: hypothetical protein ACK5P5_09300, partial [Pseudobdellovibrionaceae bacterium]